MANPEEEARIRKLIADSVEGGKRGNAAFAQVVTAYQSRVRAFCIRMVRNTADADDLTEQAFVAWLEAELEQRCEREPPAALISVALSGGDEDDS